MVTWWTLLLSLATSFAPPEGPNGTRDPVRGLKLARGWVTARLIYEGMPFSLWRPLAAEMRCGGSVRGLAGYDIYPENGLEVTSAFGDCTAIRARYVGPEKWARLLPTTKPAP